MEEMTILWTLMFWLFLSIISGVIAGNKGRMAFGYFLLSVLLSPLIGIIVALVVSPNKDNLENRQLSKGMKKCPYCAELIKAEAKVCRYCGKDLLVPALTEVSGEYWRERLESGLSREGNYT